MKQNNFLSVPLYHLYLFLCIITTIHHTLLLTTDKFFKAITKEQHTLFLHLCSDSPFCLSIRIWCRRTIMWSTHSCETQSLTAVAYWSDLLIVLNQFISLFFCETHQLLSQAIQFVVYHTNELSLVCHFYVFWSSDTQGLRQHSNHHKQPAFDSEFRSERLLQQ